MDFCTWLEARNRILGPYAQSLFGNRSGFGSIVDQSNDSLGCFWQWWVGRYLFFIHLELHRTCAEHGFLEMELLKKCSFLSGFLQSWHCNLSRFYLPLKPVLSTSCIDGLSDYAEMSSRYKASHINRMIWWIARKTHEISEQWPDETWIHLYSPILLRMYHSNTPHGFKYFFLKLFFKIFVPKDVVLQLLASCCYGKQHLVDIMHGSNTTLSCDDANDAVESMKLHLKTFVWLALQTNDAIQPGAKIALFVAHGVHTFSDENCLGKIKAITAIVLKTHGRTMAQRIFQRYLLFMAVFLHQNRNWKTIKWNEQVWIFFSGESDKDHSQKIQHIQMH